MIAFQMQRMTNWFQQKREKISINLDFLLGSFSFLWALGKPIGDQGENNKLCDEGMAMCCENLK